MQEIPKTKRWKPFLLGVAVGLTLSLLALGVCFWLALENFSYASTRGTILQQYAFAFDYHKTKGLPVPDSLEEIIRTYSAGSGDQIPADWVRPEYRPAGHLKDGPYLVLIEQPPQHWLARERNVLYAYPDGLVDEIVPIPEDLLHIALARDDRHREIGAETRPSAPSTRPAVRDTATQRFTGDHGR